jgi:hypothetical protein
VWAHELLSPLTGREAKTSGFGRPGEVLPVLRRPRAGPLRTKTIRAVCRRCNGGWMSALEEEVRPILTPLIRGEAFFLEDVSQRSVAAWVTMKFIVAQQTYEPITTREERQHFKQTLTPLKSWNIWLFPTASAEWYYRQPASTGLAGQIIPAGRPKPNSQSITLGIGKLLIFAVSFGIDKPVEDFRITRFGRNIWPGHLGRRIWPTIPDFQWPPGPPIDAAQAHQIASMFGSTIAKAPPNPFLILRDGRSWRSPR